MDFIKNLPINKNLKPTESEKNIIKTLFDDNIHYESNSSIECISEPKLIFLSTMIFLILGTSYFDKFLNYFPNSDSVLFRLGLKALFFAVSLYIIIIFSS